jgi:ASC-1-like (ASCH) protein
MIINRDAGPKKIKKLVLSFAGCLMLVSLATAGNLRIQYHHAGLMKIEVSIENQLRFEWHTGRRSFQEGDCFPMKQSLESYDSHMALIWLTGMEMGSFENWIVRNGILDLDALYPEPEEKTYGSAFCSSLIVELNGRKYSLEWTGDTKVPETLHRAINQLIRLCREIRRNREDG